MRTHTHTPRPFFFFLVTTDMIRLKAYFFFVVLSVANVDNAYNFNEQDRRVYMPERWSKQSLNVNWKQ